MSKIPFNGHFNEKIGLTNEQELAAKCPDKYWKKDNKWYNAATAYMEGRGPATGLKYRADTQKEGFRQMDMITAVISSNELSPVKKHAVVAWMLKEALKEPPNV